MYQGKRDQDEQEDKDDIEFIEREKEGVKKKRMEKRKRDWVEKKGVERVCEELGKVNVTQRKK